MIYIHHVNNLITQAAATAFMAAFSYHDDLDNSSQLIKPGHCQPQRVSISHRELSHE